MAILLSEQEIFPSKEVLQNALGKVYCILEELENCLMQDEFSLTFNWDYHCLLKSWRCKVCHRTNTLFWFSVWDGFFKTLFLFTDEQMKDIVNLDIHEQIKEDFNSANHIRKLHSLYLDINKKEQLTDLLKIIRLKSCRYYEEKLT